MVDPSSQIQNISVVNVKDRRKYQKLSGMYYRLSRIINTRLNFLYLLYNVCLNLVSEIHSLSGTSQISNAICDKTWKNALHANINSIHEDKVWLSTGIDMTLNRFHSSNIRSCYNLHHYMRPTDILIEYLFAPLYSTTVNHNWFFTMLLVLRCHLSEMPIFMAYRV